MYKKFLPVTLTAFVLTMGSPTNVLAQHPSHKIDAVWAKMSPEKRAQALEQMKKERRIPEKLHLNQARPANKLFVKPAAGTQLSLLKPFQVPLGVSSNTTIWADIYFNNQWEQDSYHYGIYSFAPVASPTYTLLSPEADGMRAEDGVQLKGNHLYSVQGTYVGSNYYAYLYDTNISTWETTYEALDDYSLIAHETCRAADGTTYGVFYNEDASASQWAIIDYETRTKTVLANTNNTYKAIGITKAGMLYGIASDGNLYKFDKSTGVETLVGSTGLTLANSSGTSYTQTGEIDQSDDTFYWAAIDINGNPGFYKVNLETAALTTINNNVVGMVGMVIPGEIAEDDAPAAVSNLSATFEGLSLDGTLTFTAPSTTFAGGGLAGSLSYEITCNGNVIKSGTTKAGATVTENISVEKSGDYNFGVTTKNNAGASPTASVNVWVGYDQPNPPTNVTMMVNNGKATIFWTKPTAGVHGGDMGDLSYDVYRVGGSKRTLIASGITVTQTTDDVSELALGTYHYEVYAKNRDLSSVVASSNSQMIGDAIVPTWSIELANNEQALDVFTVLDNNGDGQKWDVVADSYSDSTFVSVKPSTKNGNDDWLFTAPIRMTTDRAYVVKFTARNKYGIGGNEEIADYRNTLEVKWGTSATPSGMTSTLLSATKIDKTKTEFSYEIRPTTDGLYYIGFHDCTPTADCGYIYLYDLNIEAGARATAPDQVTNLTLTPGEKGELTATLSFNAPAKSVDGAAIAGVDSIAIVRGNELIATLGEKKAGEAVIYEDETIPYDGTYTYIVYAFNKDEYGSSAVVTGYVGEDTPNAPENVELTDQENSVLVTWDAFGETGINGGYIDPAKQKVEVYSVAENYYGGLYLNECVAISENGATSVAVDQNTEDAITTDGTQGFLYYAAHTSGTASNSVTLSNGILVGPSLTLPFKESFAGADVDNKVIWVENNDAINNRSTSSYWFTYSSPAADNDGGCALWTSYMDASGNVCSAKAGDETTLGLLKVSMKDVVAPTLTFKVYSAASAQARIDVLVQTPDGNQEVVKACDLTKEKSGWKTYTVDLTQYKGQRYIIPAFRGVALGDGITVAIDDINILDKLTDNLQAASLSVPASVKAGRKANASVTVKNLGSNAAEGFSVKLYADDEVVAETAVNEALASMAETAVNVAWPVKVNGESPVQVKAEVVYDKDMKAADNMTGVKSVEVLPTHTATVNDLVGEKAGEGIALLTWSKPAAVEAVTVTEDFEDYSAWATSFGDWTLIDGNPSAQAGSFATNYNSKMTGESLAFTIFEPSTLFSEFNALTENPGLGAYSGNKYAAALGEFDESNSAVAGDDWLISPVLSGNGQTISFHALNFPSYPETFDLLISITDNSQSSFTKIATYTVNGSNPISGEPNWQDFSLYVPDGTKYFAIHHNTSSDYAFLFGVDDVTYEAGADCADDEIVGYNVYRDGVLIGTVTGSELTYTDSEGGAGAHNYNVTVLFKDKDGNVTESSFSNTVTLTTGIASIEAALQAESYTVCTIDGKLIMKDAKSLNGLKKGMYIINDRKFILK